MLPEIVEKWDKYSAKLEEYFKNTAQREYDTYENIVKALITCVLNATYTDYDVDNLTVIDHGDYQGTILFIVPKSSYQPNVEDYIYTSTYYGSCSACDTLQAISGYSIEKPTDEQVKDYMTLALHLIQRMKRMNADES
jgi:hypothetical protein